MSRRSIVLLGIGGALSAGGSMLMLWLEIRSSSATDFEAENLIGRIGLIAVLLGPVFLISGALTAAKHAAARGLLTWGIILGLAATVGTLTMPINVHAWTFTLAFPLLTAALLSAVFLLGAGLRSFQARQAMRSGPPH
jgi:small-conductance mechanosensitive channel